MAHTYTINFYCPAYGTTFSAFYPTCTVKSNLGTIKSATKDESKKLYSVIVELSDQEYQQITYNFTVTFTFTIGATYQNLLQASSTQRGTLIHDTAPTLTTLRVRVPKDSTGGTAGAVYKKAASIYYYEGNTYKTSQSLGTYDLANDATGSFTASGTLKSISISTDGASLLGYSKVKGSTVASYATNGTISHTFSYNDTILEVYAVLGYYIQGTGRFYYNDGTSNYTDVSNYNSQSPTTSGTVGISTPSAPTRSGYQFMGWNTNQSGTGSSYGSGQGITINAAPGGKITSYYAQWKQTHWAVYGQATFYDINGDYFTTISASNNAFEGTSGYIEKDVPIPGNTTYYKFTGYQQKNAASNTATLTSESATTIKVQIPVGVADMGGITSEFISLTEQIAWDIGYTLQVWNGHTDNNNVSTYYPKKKAHSKKQDTINQTLPQPQTANIDQDKYYFDKWVETSTSGSVGEYAAGSNYPGLATTNYPLYTLSGRWLTYYDIGFSYHYTNASSGAYPSASTVTLPQNYSYRNQKSKSSTNEITRVLYPAITTDSNYRFAYWIDQFGTKYYMNASTNSYSKTFTANEDRTDYILTAVWQRKVYCTIEFQDTVSNHGTQTGWPDDWPLETWSYSDTFTTDYTRSIASPESTNYIFDGWGESVTATKYKGTITLQVTYTASGNTQHVYAYWTERTYGPFHFQFQCPNFLSVFDEAYTFTGLNATPNSTYYTTSQSGGYYRVTFNGLGYTKFTPESNIMIKFNYTNKLDVFDAANAVTYYGVDDSHQFACSPHSSIGMTFKIKELSANSVKIIKMIYWYSPQLMGIKLRDYYGNKLGSSNTEYLLYPSSYNGTSYANAPDGLFPLDDDLGVVQAVYTAPGQLSINTQDAETKQNKFQFIGWQSSMQSSSTVSLWTANTDKQLNVTIADLTYQNNYLGLNKTYYEAGYLLRTYWLKVIFDVAGGAFSDPATYESSILFHGKTYDMTSCLVSAKTHPVAPLWPTEDKSFSYWKTGGNEYGIDETFQWSAYSQDINSPTVVTLTAIYLYNYYGSIVFTCSRTLSDGTESLLKLKREYTKENPLQAETQNGATVTLTKEDLMAYPLQLKDAEHFKFVGWHQNASDVNYTYTTVGKGDDDGETISFTFTWGEPSKNTFNLWAAFRCLHRYRATLKFDLNGGTSNTIKDMVMPSSGVAYWDEITETLPKYLKFNLPAVSATNPVKLGYYCIDWSKKKDSETDRIKDTSYSITPNKASFPADDKIYEITETLYAFYKPITWTLTIKYNANTTRGDGKANGLATPLKVTTQTFKYTYDPTNTEANKQIYENIKYKFKVTIPDQEPKCNNTQWYFLEWNTLSDTSEDNGQSYFPKKTYDIQAYGDYESTTRPAVDYNLYAIWTQGTIVWIYDSRYGGWCKAIPYINGSKAQTKIFGNYSGTNGWR